MKKRGSLKGRPNDKEIPEMKRVLSVMTAAVFAGALAMPVFAQDTGAAGGAPAAPAASSSATAPS